MPPAPPDWRLPEGVNRPLWDYVHSASLAQGYDAGLAGSELFRADEDFVRRYAPPPGRLIDLGCGTGRLLTSMAQLGWWGLGVDLSAAMLGVAHAKAREARLDVSLLQANLVELEAIAPGSFDLATCLFSTLGMVIGPPTRQRALISARRLLRPGGRLILHIHNRWFRLWDGPGRRWLLSDLPRHWRGDPSAGDHVMPTHQGIAGLTLHLFSRAEAVAMLQQASFRILAIEPVSVRPPAPHFLSNWRAYGFLIAAEET